MPDGTENLGNDGMQDSSALGGDEVGTPDIPDGTGIADGGATEDDDEMSGIMSRLSPKDRESVLSYAKSMVSDDDGAAPADSETMMERRIVLTKGQIRIMSEALMRPGDGAADSGRNPLNPKHGGKRIPSPFVSPSFAEHLDEDNVNITAQARGNSLSDFSNAAGSSETAADIQKAKNAGGDVTLTVSGPETNDSQPQQQVNVGAGESIQSAVSNQANDTIIRNGGSVKITGDGIGK